MSSSLNPDTISSPPASVYLFVYGSLRSGMDSPAREYMDQYFEYIGQGQVPGQLYDLGPYPAAIPFDGSFRVTGELYKLKDPLHFVAAFFQLDHYEGVDADDPAASLYYRAIVEVTTGNQQVQSWIYWYNDDMSDKQPVESGDYLQYLQQTKSP